MVASGALRMMEGYHRRISFYFTQISFLEPSYFSLSRFVICSGFFLLQQSSSYGSSDLSCHKFYFLFTCSKKIRGRISTQVKSRTIVGFWV
ncbi:hypothetical protein L1887_24062 [Cichorium endivia]|nr:hypothetical protein L1887_24062 [Cichorium endivia]